MRLIFFALLALSAACGCITGLSEGKKEAPQPAAPPAPTPAPSLREASVATAWQKDLAARLEADPKATIAYGLFSEGGWADAGQTMVFVDDGGARVVIVPAGRTAPEPERALTAAEWTELKPLAEAGSALASIEIQAFDQLVFDFVRATKGQGIDRRFHYANPGKVKSPAHEDLIGAMMALGRPAKKGN